MQKLEGAEAILTPTTLAGIPALRKERLAKSYRPPTLDEKIRSSRTRVEARLLHKAKMAGVPCPTVLAVGPYSITMSKMGGQTLHALDGKKLPTSIWTRTGKYLARLHEAHVVHGDFTPANLMNMDRGMAVIDFGLGAISPDIEDKGTDVLTMKKALGKQGGAFAHVLLHQCGVRDGIAAQKKNPRDPKLKPEL